MSALTLPFYNMTWTLYMDIVITSPKLEHNNNILLGIIVSHNDITVMLL